jgi:hypothetical protein
VAVAVYRRFRTLLFVVACSKSAPCELSPRLCLSNPDSRPPQRHAHTNLACSLPAMKLGSQHHGLKEDSLEDLGRWNTARKLRGRIGNLDGECSVE